MAKTPERRAGQLLLLEARNLGRQYNHIGESANWLTLNRQETLARESTFTAVINSINTSSNNADVYRDVAKLRLLTANETLPTLGQIIENCDELAQQTLREAVETYPGWSNDHFSSEGSSVWGMIIEGYGKYLGKRFGHNDEQKQEEINRTFVLAFEAVTFTEHRNSGLVVDVIDWMKEEKDSFPDQIASQL